MFILLSLVMDGVTGGVQKRLKSDMSRIGLTPKPYDFMLFTNLSMCAVALVISVCLGEIWTGYKFCVKNPAILTLVVHFSICSAIGQSFIFYTVATFDPLVCSTVTTTRKIFSVLLSIFTKGHPMSGQGWTGVSIACAGILSEVHAKFTNARKLKSKVSM
jgi:UDP-galactose transporter B1